MSLVYRAIWQDDLDGVCGKAAGIFDEWVRRRIPEGTEISEVGRSQVQTQRNGQQVDIEIISEHSSAIEGSVSEVYRAQLIETFASGARWHTTLRTWETTSDEIQPSGCAWIWVDVEVVGDVDITSLAPCAPNLVHQLLRAGKNPRVQGEALTQQPRMVFGADAGDELAEELARFDRILPVVVFHNDPSRVDAIRRGDYTFGQILQVTARGTAGIANVISVDNDAARALTDVLTPSHGLWDGAFRMYLKDLDPATHGDGWRHRYVTADRYLTSKSTARDIVGRTLSPISSIRRPPESFNAAKSLLARAATGSADDNELLAYADAQVCEVEAANAELLERIRQADEDAQAQAMDLEEAIEDRMRAIEQAERLARHVAYLTRQLAVRHTADHFSETAEAVSPFPTTAANLSDAAQKAQDLLADRLVIPDAALRDLAVLDATVTAGSWGHLSWLAFRSLHAYATVLASNGWRKGGFWEWCKESGNPLAWKATDKKLAMNESKTVYNNKKLAQCRVLPVATEVDPSGELYMEAHIKIATGGGNLAPRIYFHIGNDNAKVHVGFFGPHKYMPNTKS